MSISEESASTYSNEVIEKVSKKYPLAEDIREILKELLYSAYKDGMDTSASVLRGICDKITGK